MTKSKHSTWSVSDGIWTLTGCPAGYYLSERQCQLCPASLYRTGGIILTTPCDSGLFSLPGGSSKASCFPSVFVIVAVSLPVTSQFL